MTESSQQRLSSDLFPHIGYADIRASIGLQYAKLARAPQEEPSAGQIGSEKQQSDETDEIARLVHQRARAYQARERLTGSAAR